MAPQENDEVLVPGLTAPEIVSAMPAQTASAVAVEVATATGPLATTLAAATSLAAQTLGQVLAVIATQTIHQPLADILREYTVQLPAGQAATVEEIDDSLARLDVLLQALQQCSLPHVGYSPGFDTIVDQVGQVWCAADGTPYETMDFSILQSTYTVPIPSAAVALKCFLLIKTVFQERRRYLSCQEKDSSSCPCIASWEWDDRAAMLAMSNMTLEQLMCREASESVTTILSLTGDTSTASAWDQMYAAPLCPSPDQMDDVYVSAPVRLIVNRDSFVSTTCKYALAARTSICISTCYLFFRDAAHRYILMDLLPHVIQKYGVTVRVLIDLMTVESAVINSGFSVRSGGGRKPRGGATESMTMTSFLNYLPSDCPQPSASLKPQSSALNFFNELLQLASTMPEGRYQINWWCARDAKYKYRIKNHTKCICFDGQVAIMGGSNLCPTLASALTELDILVAGPAAGEIDKTFQMNWKAVDHRMTTMNYSYVSLSAKENQTNSFALIDENDRCPPATPLDAALETETWSDENCRVAVIRSQPSSEGEDSIYRVVLGAINRAEKSVRVCMGHANFPLSFAETVSAACRRGVRVQLLVNSMYSNDLRCGQLDLFLSLRDLLRMAPNVEVYATTLLRGCESRLERSFFIHAKYVVVDGQWCAVGSWNLWTRGAFYEMEHEALIQSPKIAHMMETKFELNKEATAVRLETANDCEPGKGFCPVGCILCQGFGPFFTK